MGPELMTQLPRRCAREPQIENEGGYSATL